MIYSPVTEDVVQEQDQTVESWPDWKKHAISLSMEVNYDLELIERILSGIRGNSLGHE